MITSSCLRIRYLFEWYIFYMLYQVCIGVSWIIGFIQVGIQYVSETLFGYRYPFYVCVEDSILEQLVVQ